MLTSNSHTLVTLNMSCFLQGLIQSLKESKILVYLNGNRSDHNIVHIKVVARNHTKQIKKDRIVKSFKLTALERFMLA